MFHGISANKVGGQIQLKSFVLLQVCQEWLTSIGKITITNTNAKIAPETFDKFL